MSSDAYSRVMTGLHEALAHANGEEVSGVVLHVPETIDVAGIRKRTGLSQAAFSTRIGVAVATLKNWEQGRRKPDGPARVLLALIDRNPRIVEDTLGKAA
jgi:putative transcriptional regulator